MSDQRLNGLILTNHQFIQKCNEKSSGLTTSPIFYTKISPSTGVSHSSPSTQTHANKSHSVASILRDPSPYFLRATGERKKESNHKHKQQSKASKMSPTKSCYSMVSAK